MSESVHVPLPSALPDGLPATGFSVEDAARASVARARLRASDLSAPFHGVRRVGVPTSIIDLAQAYAARMMADARFTHTTAAQILGLRMPEGFAEAAIHVARAVPHRAPRGAGVIGHRVDRDSAVVTVQGLRVSAPLEVWIQCGSMLAVDDLVIMGDGLVRRRQPEATLEQLAAVVDAASRRPGVALLRQALPWIRPGTDSARETLLRLLVLRAGFPEPEVNGVITNRYGAEIAHGDLVYRAQRVIVEYDGRQHADEGQFSVDIARLDELMEEEWRVIRVDKALMARRAELLRKIEVALNRARALS